MSVFTIFALLPVLASGGQITGTLFKEGKPANELKIQLSCDKVLVAPMYFDASASFSFYVDKSGICYFEVLDLGLSHKVYSYETPIHYDFDLFRQSDGSYLIRRH